MLAMFLPEALELCNVFVFFSMVLLNRMFVVIVLFVVSGLLSATVTVCLLFVESFVTILPYEASSSCTENTLQLG